MSLTKQQLRERAQQVAHAHLSRELAMVADRDELAALAEAWGVEVDDAPPLSRWHVTYHMVADGHTQTVEAVSAPEAVKLIQRSHNQPIMADSAERVSGLLCPNSGAFCLYGVTYTCSCGARGRQVDRRVPDHYLP